MPGLCIPSGCRTLCTQTTRVDNSRHVSWSLQHAVQSTAALQLKQGTNVFVLLSMMCVICHSGACLHTQRSSPWLRPMRSATMPSGPSALLHTSTSVCSTILSAWLLVSLTAGTQICSQQHAAVPRTQTQGQQCPHVTACDCCWPQSCVALPISPYNLNRRRDVRFGLYFCCFIPESECLFVFHRGETIRAETSCVEIVNYRK